MLTSLLNPGAMPWSLKGSDVFIGGEFSDNLDQLQLGLTPLPSIAQVEQTILSWEDNARNREYQGIDSFLNDA